MDKPSREMCFYQKLKIKLKRMSAMQQLCMQMMHRDNMQTLKLRVTNAARLNVIHMLFLILRGMTQNEKQH